MEPLPLRDIHLPAPIGWWPPAPGWWLALLALVLLAAGLAWLVRRRRRTAVVRLALRELETLRTDAGLTPNQRLQKLSILLRRVCLSVYAREDVAGLTGEAWLRWLDRPFKTPRFAEAGRPLIDAPYRPSGAADAERLLRLCCDWLNALPKSELKRSARGKTIES
jgi:LPXTG-motif cell wall-anchored protein